ncbi:MAG: DNA-binding domain-containing protein [Pseudomonadota bacterium]
MSDQSSFQAAILDAAAPVPGGVVNPSGAPASRRFDVYRNNVAVSLTEALETGFPVLRKLVGARFFQAMAGVHLRQHPPRSPLMMFYGEDMPTFLASFPPAASLPYLPDIARLELAIRGAYHAADKPPIDPADLASIPSERLVDIRIELAPAVAIIASDYPIHAIWRANTEAGGPKPEGGAEAVMISRPDLDPVLDPLAPAARALLLALQDGRTLGAAFDQAVAVDPAFDLTPSLSLLLARQAVTALKEGPAS